MKTSNPYSARLFLGILASCFSLASCAMVGITPKPLPPPEIKSYTPFPVALLEGEWEDKSFFAAVTKVTLKIYPDGTTRPDQAQECFSANATAKSKVCTVGDFQNAFKPLADLQVLDPKGSQAWTSLKVIRPKGVLEADTAKMTRLPYIDDGDKFELRGKDGARQLYTVPKDFLPYVLVRYDSGELVSAPMRLDTVLVDGQAKRIFLTYRGTFENDYIRKIEFRLLQPNSALKGNETETPEEQRARTNETREALRLCPEPKAPIERCVTREQARG